MEKHTKLLKKMELKKAIEERRSVRVFLDEPIEPYLLKEIVKAGSLAPSSCNKQPWYFIVLTDQKLKERIHKECGSQSIIARAPACIAVCYNHVTSKEHNANIQSVSAAVQNMSLRAFDLGLGATWVAGFGDWKIAGDILGLPSFMKIMCFLVIGKPKIIPPSPKKKSLDVIMDFNYYGGSKFYLPRTIRASKWTLDQVKHNQKLLYRAREMSKDRELWGKEDIDVMRNVLQKELPLKKSNILNLFAYDGTILRHIHDLMLNHNFQTCELTDEATDILKYKFKGLKTSVFEKNIPFKANHFDVVFLSFSLEKIPVKSLVLKEAKRVLKPGGKIIIFFKNKLSPYGLLYASWLLAGINMQDNAFISPDPFEPVNYFKLKKLMLKTGFRVRAGTLQFFLPEILIYKKKFGGFKKRFGTTFKFKFLMSLSLRMGSFVFHISKKLKIPLFSSSMYFIGKK